MTKEDIISVEHFRWDLWINGSFQYCDTIVDFGAGFFERLMLVSRPGIKKIGIEMYQPYINNARYNDCIKVQGDMRDYKALTQDLWVGRLGAMFIDTLEHIDKEDAYALINDIKNYFDVILVMSPRGVHIQESDPTGFGNHEGQRHKSSWYNEDWIALGMTSVFCQDNFHDKEGLTDRGCFFAKWERI